MNAKKLIDAIEKKIQLLAGADEEAIKRAEEVYIARNAQLKKEIAALKEKLIDLELVAGCRFISVSI